MRAIQLEPIEKFSMDWWMKTGVNIELHNQFNVDEHEKTLALNTGSRSWNIASTMSSPRVLFKQSLWVLMMLNVTNNSLTRFSRAKIESDIKQGALYMHFFSLISFYRELQYCRTKRYIIRQLFESIPAANVFISYSESTWTRIH